MATQTRNLYSLNDRDIEVELGQLRKMKINGRPAGAPWGVTIISDRNVRADKGDDEMPLVTVTALQIATDIVGRYSGQGLFLAEVDDKPSPAEIEQAAREFELSDRVLIEAANLVWDATHNRNKIDVQARHAARRRNQKVDWAIDTIVELIPCPFCSESVRKTAAKCRHCNEWIDESKRPAAAAEALTPAGARLAAGKR